jgi:hypothetical protein
MKWSAFSKSTLRLQCLILLATPLFCAWVAPVVARGHVSILPSPWLPFANWSFLAIAVYLFTAPFIVEVTMRRSRERIFAKGFNPDMVVLLTGVGGSAAVASLTLLLVIFGDGSVGRVYGWAPVSLVIGGFWCWRFRKFLS